MARLWGGAENGEHWFSFITHPRICTPRLTCTSRMPWVGPTSAGQSSLTSSCP